MLISNSIQSGVTLTVHPRIFSYICDRKAGSGVKSTSSHRVHIVHHIPCFTWDVVVFTIQSTDSIRRERASKLHCMTLVLAQNPPVNFLLRMKLQLISSRTFRMIIVILLDTIQCCRSFRKVPLNTLLNASPKSTRLMYMMNPSSDQNCWYSVGPCLALLKNSLLISKLGVCWTFQQHCQNLYPMIQS